MNTDKIFAEAIANEYAPKDTSKVVALRKLDRRPEPGEYLRLFLRRLYDPGAGPGDVPFHGRDRRRQPADDGRWDSLGVLAWWAWA